MIEAENRSERQAELDKIRETRELIDQVCRMAVLIPAADVRVLRQAMERYSAIGPLIDPSAYRIAVPTQRKREKIMAAFAEFHGVLRAIWEEEKAQAERPVEIWRTCEHLEARQEGGAWSVVGVGPI